MNHLEDDEGWAPTPLAVELLTVAFVLVALTAGGSSNPVSSGIVRVASLPVLFVALWRASTWPGARAWAWPALTLLAAIALCLAQLVPLPPEVWSALPGRGLIVEGYAAAGLAPPALPLSMAPRETLDSLLGLLPPAAAFFAVMGLDEAARRRLAILVVVVALISICLGMLQIAGGERSALRFYAFTNLNAAVGFFANRNHQASFLVAAIPLAAGVAASFARRPSRAAFVTVAAVSVVVVLMIGVAVTRSRAGVVLLLPAFLGALLVMSRARQGRSGLRALWPAAAMGGAILAGAVLIGLFSFTALADRFASGDETRPRIARTVIEAGQDYAPFGTGVGSFAPVFRIHEPGEGLMSAFVNHAHNDYAEVWLEAGWPGLAIIVAFAAWWAGSLLGIARTWRAPGRGLQLAGATVVGVYLAHALGDYPLRSPAAAVVFAMACGLMIPLAWESEDEIGEA